MKHFVTLTQLSPGLMGEGYKDPTQIIDEHESEEAAREHARKVHEEHPEAEIKGYRLLFRAKTETTTKFDVGCPT